MYVCIKYIFLYIVDDKGKKFICFYLSMLEFFICWLYFWGEGDGDGYNFFFNIKYFFL